MAVEKVLAECQGTLCEQYFVIMQSVLIQFASDGFSPQKTY